MITPDTIAKAIMEMYGTLCLLDGLETPRISRTRYRLHQAHRPNSPYACMIPTLKRQLDRFLADPNEVYVPFSENIHNAVTAFARPALRQELVRLLYGEVRR